MLLRQLPALTSHYGLRPWEVEALTFAELEEYLHQMEVSISEQRRQTEELNRRMNKGRAGG